MNISFRLPTVAAVAAFAVLLGAGSAKASTIVVGDQVTFAHGLYGTTGGGEFTLTDLTHPQSITTFCLQMTEYLDYSTTFTVGGITKYATWEGAATGGDGTGKDYISPETAYLYTQFSLGTAGFVPTSNGSADDFQRAIWMFENEIAVDASNPFYAAATAAVAGDAGRARVTYTC